MRRVPPVATLVVALAVAAMIALGVWQLQRRHEKLALIAELAGRPALPPVALPAHPDDRLLFRRATATCRQVVRWRREAGRAADGSSGWRAIAECRTDANGPALAMQMGVGADALRAPAWSGGTVAGYLSHAPQHRAVIAGLFDHTPPPMMLVADRPLPGLKPNPAATLVDVPNNHLAYAVQWFLFAAIAAIIYAAALWRRGHPVAVAPARG